MSPQSYRKELLDKHEPKNKENTKLFMDKISSGVTLIGTGECSGPYTKSTTYFMSDGEHITIVSSSRHPLPINIPII